VDYALLILSYLCHRSEGASAREIAAAFEGLSRSFAANILKELCQQGFVTSHRGAKGGYVLQRPAEEISLLELMDSLDDSVHVAECNKTAKDDFCSLLSVCPMRNAIGQVHQRVREVLSNVTVAELFPPGGHGASGVQYGLELLPLEQQLAMP
jgi:Rrf2 family protein